MKISEKNRIKKRIYLIGSMFAFFFLIIIARAYQIQVRDGDLLRKKAQKDYIHTRLLLSKRGTIFDRKGRPFAISVESKSIYARPYLIEDKKRTARILARITGGSWHRILKKLSKNAQFVWIKRKVPDQWAKRILDMKIKGIGIVDDTRRYYPGRELAAHVIGFTGIDNQGLEGIEKKYDSLLRGHKIKLLEVKDALRRPLIIRDFFYGDSRDIVLTIDREIQFKVQEELRKAVRKYHARSGQCIVMDPNTGEILAMAVVPEFNPNMFNKYKPSYWRNRAITDCYEPGSVLKPFLAASAIEEGVVTPHTVLFCENGSYRIKDHVIHDTHKHGKLSVSEIIMVSSNIGAIKIGQRLGYSRFCSYLKRFGFGEKTGIDLIGERKGHIKMVKENRPVDQATLFFGQGISITSIQLATAMAAIANGGLLMRPYVVKEITDKNGDILAKTYPKVIRRVISKETSDQLKHMMELVVSKNGTAPKAALDGFKVAGKTGTAQKIDPRTKRYSNKKYVSIFVGFVPVKKPRLLILVMIDEPVGMYYGGIVAAPVFRKIAQWVLTYIGVWPQQKEEKDEPLIVNNTEPYSVPDKKPDENIRHGLLPNLRGMSIREVLKIAYGNNIRVIIKGHGYAIKQYPRPGTPLKRIRLLKVYFRPIKGI